MTETSGTYDVVPTRCYCDADWRVTRRGFVQCTRCGEWLVNSEAAARWNEQRAEVERLRSELALEKDKCGRCGLFISHQPLAHHDEDQQDSDQNEACSTTTGWACPICGRALAIWVLACDHGRVAPATRTATSDGERWHCWE